MKKVKRVVLGEGYPWFKKDGYKEGPFTHVCLGVDPDGQELVDLGDSKFCIMGGGGYEGCIRLVAEILPKRQRRRKS